MLAEQLFQTIKDLEILHNLGWRAELVSIERNALKFSLKTAVGKIWFRIDIYPQKDKPFRYFFSHMSQPVEVQTKEEVAAWLLSDFATFYVLLLLQQVLEPILGHKPFNVPPNPYSKGNDFRLVVDEIAIVTTHIFKRPDYNENGIVTVQVPQNLNPDGFYAALAYNKEGEVSHCRLKPTASCRHDADERLVPLRARSEPNLLGGSLSLPDKIITQPKERRIPLSPKGDSPLRPFSMEL